ncbi:MAG: EAL domain-containing protein [Ruminococcus sp.]|nr:EAL domain-containing protein [Ruminococcus sp.]
MEMDNINKSLEQLHRFLDKLQHISDISELDELIKNYRTDKYSGIMGQLFSDGIALGSLIAELKGTNSLFHQRIAALSPQEKAEFDETQRILNENLFTYHFQPIVKVADGEIYAYEALMRPVSEICPKPYHILKYAEMADRTDEIERLTFLNILHLIDRDPSKFSGKKVFINSIPNSHLSLDDLREIGSLMMKYSDSLVVEMTEQTEADEEALGAIKERYSNLGIPLAVDDYGTGYSNVKNLLSYMPNYVKIDRSLLTELQNSTKQRHFVREIIGFCHDNGIMALAEGVETSEELRTVILLGADLIQGFYTAKPSPEPVPVVSDDILHEIQQHRREREDGKGQHIYVADCTERISLDRLHKDGIDNILVGKNGNGDISVSGTLSEDTSIHMEIMKGYSGKITLENVWLSNVKSRPCIEIGDNCDVTIELVGENNLEHGGIHVPESSRLTMKGAGKLYITLDSKEYYGIGNGIGLRHGEMIFDQSGCITITGSGQTGVAIGAGSGGILRILQGQYRINLNGELGLGIGSLYTIGELDIHDCDISMNMSLGKGVGIGSLGSDCDLSLRKSSVKLHLSGLQIVGLGSIHGETAKVSVQDASVIMNLRAERCSAIAALDGATVYRSERASLRVTSGGEQVLPIGGFTGDTELSLITADTNIKLETNIELDKYLSAVKIDLVSGWYRLCVNGVDIYNNTEPPQ